MQSGVAAHPGALSRRVRDVRLQLSQSGGQGSEMEDPVATLFDRVELPRSFRADRRPLPSAAVGRQFIAVFVPFVSLDSTI